MSPPPDRHEDACTPRIRFRAPGKVVLIGEYAVVDGAPAIVAAVDRGVEVEVLRGFGPVVVHAPGDGRYAAESLSAVGAPGGTYLFRDWNPASTVTKAGFGGSAAACVAAALAGRSLLGDPPAADRLVDLAEPVHRRVQGGGSGVDIAASAYGGVLMYQRVGDSPAGPLFRARPAPAVRPIVVWSGQSASTGPRVARYLDWRDRSVFVKRSAELVREFPSDPVRTLREARRLLAAMAQTAGVDWDTPAHTRISELAESFGGAAKPSGAGGGDIAVALFNELDASAAFVESCRSEGLVPVPVALARGARAVPTGAP